VYRQELSICFKKCDNGTTRSGGVEERTIKDFGHAHGKGRGEAVKDLVMGRDGLPDNISIRITIFRKKSPLCP
jgi:hypothetical protein